jgi:hypothetical protein
MGGLSLFPEDCPPADSASIREPDVIELTCFKYVISLHADHPLARAFSSAIFHIRNARLPCHDEIRRESKGESSKIH